MSELGQEIPVIDLKDLSSPFMEDRQRASEAIRFAFGTFGLIYIQNHGIESASLDAFYDAFIEFTDRPEEEKRKVSAPEIWFQRGWTPPNTERAVVAGGQPDFKECYFMAPEALDPVAAMQYPEVFAENIWPENADKFREEYLKIGHQLHQIGLGLLRGCAQALKLTPFIFEAAVHGGPHVTRALRYIPLNESQVGSDILWGEEHTDFNLLTLLPGGRFFDPSGAPSARPDDNCGLYLRTRPTEENPEGHLIPGRPPKGCIVAQVGQQLEILTGGVFLATPHVINAPAIPGYSRTATAHFIHLHSHQILFPLAPFRTPEVIRAYSPPVLTGTYGHKTLVDIGLAPPEILSQLGYRHYDRLAEIRKREQEQQES